MDSTMENIEPEGGFSPEPMFILQGYYNSDTKKSKGLKYSIKVNSTKKEQRRNLFFETKKTSFKEYNVLQLVKINECK